MPSHSTVTITVKAEVCPLYTEMYELLGDRYTMAEYDQFVNMYIDWQAHKDVTQRGGGTEVHVWDVYSTDGAVVYCSDTAVTASAAVDEARACVGATTVLAGVQHRNLTSGDVGPMIVIAPVAATGHGDGR